MESLKAKAGLGRHLRSGLHGGRRRRNPSRAARLEGFDAKSLRDAVDRLKQQLVDAVVVLAGVQDGKAALVAGVSGSALGRVKAGDLLGEVARRIGGKGGGRPDMAQAAAMMVRRCSKRSMALSTS